MAEEVYAQSAHSAIRLNLRRPGSLSFSLGLCEAATFQTVIRSQWFWAEPVGKKASKPLVEARIPISLRHFGNRKYRRCHRV
jgi:hypothetical protein